MPATLHNTQLAKTFIAFSTSWGPKFGGINSFNYDLIRAFAAYTYADTRTVCVVLSATVEEQKRALADGFHLISLGDETGSDFSPMLEATAWDAICAEVPPFDIQQTIWLGHDRITGEVALQARDKRGGRAALIHHMSYELYEGFAETSALAKSKEDQQKQLFAAADIRLAVGPLLRDALSDSLGESVTMLVPGLADIKESIRPPNRFKAFLSGRLSDDAKKIKQAHLGVAAFGSAIHLAGQDSGLPDCLQPQNQPKLTLRGVDFEKRAQLDSQSAEDALKAFAETYAHCVYPLSALPFTTDRNALFDDLRLSSVAMMPSWHDGFGLVAWEAIAAGVPLIVSNKCGVFQLIKEMDSGLFASYILPIQVNGSHAEPFFREEDLIGLRKAIIQVGKDPQGYKNKALQLREVLLGRFGWPECAQQLLAALGWQLAAGLALPESVEAQPVADLMPALPVAPVHTDSRLDGLSMPKARWRAGAGLSESLLLRAEEAIIPFDPNRDPFLLVQLNWARLTEFPVAIRLLIGAGGVGKTRLALEMCHKLGADGWQAGFLSGDFGATAAAGLAQRIIQLEQDFLVVLDYAETRKESLKAMLAVFCRNNPKKKVRLLLLARDGGEWWANLPRESGDCEALLDGAATTGPYPVPPLHDTLETRQQAYELALQTFAARLSVSVPAHTPVLDADYFKQPLYLQMSALIALRGSRTDSAESLVRAVVNHERRYWKIALASAVPSQIDLVLFEQHAALLMTLATLAGEIAIHRDIEAVWIAAGGEKALLRTLFRELAVLYPAEKQGLQGLRPDLIGEALVAQVMLGQDGVAVLSAMLAQGKREWRYASLTVMARLLRHQDGIGVVLEKCLKKHFSKCAEEVVAVCIETPSSLPQIAESVFGNLPFESRLQVAGILEPRFQFQVLPLTGLAVLVSETIVLNKGKRLAKKHTMDLEAEFAAALHNFSFDLDLAGQLDKATSVCKQAVDIREKLAQTNPERFEPDWAASLSNYANQLANQGQYDQALLFTKQALNIRQKLAEARPEHFEADWATSLSNYANRLSDQGQHHQALRYAKQALDLREKLAHAKPERFEPDWATSLSNYAHQLANHGQHDHALRYAKRALEIQEKLAQTNPERFEPDWATSLSNYSAILFFQGQHDQALRYAKQALDIREKLAQAKPERFELAWATSLSNYAALLSDHGHHDQALGYAKQALDLREKLAKAKPERFEPDWATSLTNYASSLADQGQHDQALRYAKQALDIQEKLAQAKPERFEPDWANSLLNNANQIAETGQWDLAWQLTKQSTNVFYRCAGRLPLKYNYDYEKSRLMQVFWQWLAEGRSMVAALAHPIGKIADRDQEALAFWCAFIQVCEAPTSALIQQALSKYLHLDQAQQYTWEDPWHTLCAMATHTLGPEAVPADWLQTFAKYHQRRNGNIPQWMQEVLRRHGTSFPNLGEGTQP